VVLGWRGSKVLQFGANLLDVCLGIGLRVASKKIYLRKTGIKSRTMRFFLKKMM